MHDGNMDYYYVGDQRSKHSRRLTQSLRIVRVCKDEKDLRREEYSGQKKSTYKGRQAGRTIWL